MKRDVPILGWLPVYDRRLRFDVIAGLTLRGLPVPEMIAQAGLAGLSGRNTPGPRTSPVRATNRRGSR